MDYAKLHQLFYEAFLKAITQTGDAYKQLSWFARNKAPTGADKDEG